ncbi:MAG TPA: EAL domain-containing protein, partial [Candidatus Dormibacteraeota bacterium]
PRLLLLLPGQILLIGIGLILVGTAPNTPLGSGMVIATVCIGYSSLGYLPGLPLDLVKIDRAFVGDLDLDPETPSLIASIVRLLQRSTSTSSPRGVETSALLSTCARARGRLGTGHTCYRRPPTRTVWCGGCAATCGVPTPVRT